MSQSQHKKMFLSDAVTRYSTYQLLIWLTPEISVSSCTGESLYWSRLFTTEWCCQRKHVR